VGAVDFLWAIPVFGVLIFIHELGHFAAAKYFGITVHEFALGFGPAVAGFTKGETRYNLRAVPLGGFVRMAGMEDGDTEDPRGFARKPVYARAVVIAAGPVMNFVLASLLFSVLLMFVGTSRMDTSVLGEILTECPVGNVVKTCPASAAGLQPGDEVLTIGGKPVGDWEGLQKAVQESGGKPVTFVVRRGQQTLEARMEPIQSEDRWMVGIRPAIRKAPFFSALGQGWVQTYEMSVGWVKGLWLMVTGQMQAELSGPVGITKTIAETASRGMDMLLYLTAFLSINLGLFNLLPIPALDGSRLVFLGLEGLRGRRLDPVRENMVHFVGFLLLIGLMLVITYKEVVTR